MLLSPAVSFANLGDNELKISQTYGNPAAEQKLSPSLAERRYLREDMAITVVFLNGTSQCEIFRKADGSQFTDDQIGKILEANANRLIWTPKESAVQKTRAWIIAGPPASLGKALRAGPKSVSPETSGDPAVFAVSGRTPPSSGGKLIAVDMLDTDNDSASAPSAPPVLRKAVYECAGTNNVLAVFTAAYENVARRELPQKNPPLVSDE